MTGIVLTVYAAGAVLGVQSKPYPTIGAATDDLDAIAAAGGGRFDVVEMRREGSPDVIRAFVLRDGAFECLRRRSR